MKVSTPADVLAADMAVEWIRTAVHEAGHAVALAALDLPLHEVWVRLEPVTKLFGENSWRVRGCAEVAPGGGQVDVEDADTDTWIVATMAGPEAEARWRMRQEGVWFACTARSLVAASPYVRGDLDEIRDLLGSRHSTLIRETAQARTAELLGRRWMAVVRVGRALAESGRLTAGDVRGLM
ncbi:hypothetical protein [Saccharothrix sp. HUAS TT1]|uniref:hypothetical protein n=1 Tax=unclassified Saccharothrix TaxID=2593673 RepID=UPI00345B7F7D